ncbi:MAG: DNA repair protein RecN [Chloroflexi bacterium]|nr:DNA repair protein RecN [Chloroflexota bacterium]MCI0579428.1 DNA repair protein RecN [Chloroflexota bacterium]MCI0643371.1 DNA repair protein RecN [Chloroflexota bacterium]MCI0730072.1 DNA repair protein RecN [Chloroflexota bacterium]
MLTELYIRDFAIIDELRLQLSPGFNALTGETGAGKSIILDAMALVLGERADTTVVRSGCEEAYVEALFTLSSQVQGAVGPLLTEEGLEGDDEDALLLARELRLNGRNICRVNGRAVNLALLREIGERLVDIHGQGEHLSLLRPRSHLPLLDSFAGLEEERAALGREVARLRAVQRELQALRQDERTLAQRMDLLRFQVEEIEAAHLQAGEEEELRAERIRLANVEQLIQHTNASLALLGAVDDDALSATDMLGQVERAVAQLARLDPSQGPLLERLQGLIYQLSDITGELRNYQEQLEFNPGRLDFVEERLELISRLKRKYGDDIAAILARRAAAAAELDSITHSEERIQELEVEEEQYLRRIGQMAQALSEKRQAAAKRLAASVERELGDLRMEQARFDVAFTHRPAADGTYVDAERLAFDESGIDQAEFLVSANPGEALKPLARVASGGETSRLMLALKTVLAGADATPTLIFDEIDQGIGGRVGDVVGRKLWGLTTPARHQVIVVTHLPQLAGYADAHFHVNKRIAGGRTTTIVTSLDSGGRVEELAAMLGTQGESATGGAESILRQVATVKGADNQVIE